jgi:hypothetical protein
LTGTKGLPIVLNKVVAILLKEAIGKVYGLIVVFKKWPELKKLKENQKTVLPKEVDYIFTLANIPHISPSEIDDKRYQFLHRLINF